MKNTVIIILIIASAALSAQKSIGINTTTPQATLDIRSTGSNATPIFRIGSSASNSYFRVMPVMSYIISGNGNNGSYPLSVYPLDNTHSDFSVRDSSNPGAFLKHYNSYNAANNNAELAAYGIVRPDILSGHILLFSSGGKNSGMYLGPVSDVAGGMYVGENGNNGLGIGTTPTEKLDIGGGLRIATTPGGGTATEGGACSRPGEIVYNGNYWGCTAAGWKRMD